MNEIHIVDSEALEIQIHPSNENSIVNEESVPNEQIIHSQEAISYKDTLSNENIVSVEEVESITEKQCTIHIKHKKSECTICTESITDSSSEEESEN